MRDCTLQAECVEKKKWVLRVFLHVHETCSMHHTITKSANAAFYTLRGARGACMCWQTTTGGVKDRKERQEEEAQKGGIIHNERLAFIIRDTKVPDTSSGKIG